MGGSRQACRRTARPFRPRRHARARISEPPFPCHPTLRFPAKCRPRGRPPNAGKRQQRICGLRGRVVKCSKHDRVKRDANDAAGVVELYLLRGANAFGEQCRPQRRSAHRRMAGAAAEFTNGAAGLGRQRLLAQMAVRTGRVRLAPVLPVPLSGPIFLFLALRRLPPLWRDRLLGRVYLQRLGISALIVSPCKYRALVRRLAPGRHSPAARRDAKPCGF